MESKRNTWIRVLRTNPHIHSLRAAETKVYKNAYIYNIYMESIAAE